VIPAKSPRAAKRAQNSGAMSKQPCRFYFFKEGGCSDRRCKFQHALDVEHLALPRAAAIQLVADLRQLGLVVHCKHYYRGSCRDVGCPYAHVLQRRDLRSQTAASLGFAGNARPKLMCQETTGGSLDVPQYCLFPTHALLQCWAEAL
jgi:hypothetical protein